MADLARFLFQKSHFSAKNKRVKPGGFNPGNRPDLSVFDVHGLEDDEKEDLGDQVSALQNRAVKARAEIGLGALEGTPLDFIRDDDPIERHGNLWGWPVGDDDDAKMERVRIATSLASRASFHA